MYLVLPCPLATNDASSLEMCATTSETSRQSVRRNSEPKQTHLPLLARLPLAVLTVDGERLMHAIGDAASFLTADSETSFELQVYG